MSKAGDGIAAAAGQWTFDAEVAAVFDQHVKKSVPQYDEVQDLAAQIAGWFVQSGSVVLDIGCASGSTLALLTQGYRLNHLQMIGFDHVAAMCEQAKVKLGNRSDCDIRCVDALTTPFPENVSVAFCLYTLQFMPVEQRLVMLRKVFECLKPEGALILAEKVIDRDAYTADIYAQLHHDLKRRNGFSSDEVIGKARSLRGVLHPLTHDSNLRLLYEAGFNSVSVFHKWCNFCGYLAVKR